MLTPREREVVQLIAEGHTSKDIAERLSTAVKTIESHRTNAMGKLGLHSIAALTKFALREGLTQLAD
jgi:DNA-binding NarL/FixJ family response regulator